MTTKKLIAEAELLQNGWERLSGGEIAKTVDGVKFWLSDGKLNCFAREEHHEVPLSITDLRLICAYFEEGEYKITFEELAKILVDEYGWSYEKYDYCNGYKLKRGESLQLSEDGEVIIQTCNYSYTSALTSEELKLIAKYRKSLGRSVTTLFT